MSTDQTGVKHLAFPLVRKKFPIRNNGIMGFLNLKGIGGFVEFIFPGNAQEGGGGTFWNKGGWVLLCRMGNERKRK